MMFVCLALIQNEIFREQLVLRITGEFNNELTRLVTGEGIKFCFFKSCFEVQAFKSRKQ